MWKEIIKNLFNHIWEFLVLLFSTLLSLFLTWYPADKINLITDKIYISIIIILLVIIFILIKFIITTVMILNERNIVLPKLRTIENDVLVFSPSELFSTTSIASIWLMDDIEKNIGYGYVETVNSKKFIQVKINYYCDGYNLNFVKKNKNKIVLKPTILTSAASIISNYKEENDD